MAIDVSLLIAAPMLQDYLVDKDSGLPLSDGTVTFYQDSARTLLKNVYYQTGVPGNYSYIPLPNPLTLSGVGTIADNGGNDVIPFYYPYDEDDSSISQPYYVTVYSSGSVPQWTRENFPFVAPSSSSNTGQQNLLNLIPNGQFTSHNDLTNNGLFPNGSTTVTVAQGGSAGWYYQKPNTSTDTDFITFNTIEQEPQTLPGNPRFSINLSCTMTSGSDTAKTLRMRFNNVNRFSSDTQFYTFGFAGINNSIGTTNVTFQVYKYFGSAGSSAVTENIETFSIVNGIYTEFSQSFVFGSNSSYTIDGGDDYVELVISLPTSSVFDIALTDFILTPGSITLTDYPERPDNMVFANGIAGSMPTPNPDGSDLYLPLILTQAGVTFGTSETGQIIARVGSTAILNELPCDGSTYITSNYSSLGIPYSRLQSYLLTNGNQNIPLYGTGSTFATCYVNQSIGNYLRLTTNQPGSQTGAADGSSGTAFTFANIHTGQTTGVLAYSNSSASLLSICQTVGLVTSVNAHTSGFTVSQLVNDSLSYSKFQVVTINASSVTPGTYFTFSTPSTNYYVWFKIDGVGSDPAPGGTGIEVDLLSTFDAQEVSNCIINSISGYQVSLIQCNAASTLIGGDYWTFNANSITYNVWYKIGTSGSAPGTGTSIQVSLTGTETNDEVAEATQVAINNYAFGVPDFRGLFLRGTRGSGLNDISATSRYSLINGYYGNNIGTFEFDSNHTHSHSASTIGTASSSTDIYNTGGGSSHATIPLGNDASTIVTFSLNATTTIGSEGSAEAQPVNGYVNWFIKY
jgi:hypothetical protein